MNIEHHSLLSEGASVGASGCGPDGLGSTPSPHPKYWSIHVETEDGHYLSRFSEGVDISVLIGWLVSELSASGSPLLQVGLKEIKISRDEPASRKCLAIAGGFIKIGAALLVTWGYYIHSVKVGTLRAWIC